MELVADGIVGKGSLDIQGLLRGDGILKVSRGLSKFRGRVRCYVVVREANYRQSYIDADSRYSTHKNAALLRIRVGFYSCSLGV